MKYVSVTAAGLAEDEGHSLNNSEQLPMTVKTRIDIATTFIKLVHCVYLRIKP